MAITAVVRYDDNTKVPRGTGDTAIAFITVSFTPASLYPLGGELIDFGPLSVIPALRLFREVHAVIAGSATLNAFGGASAFGYLVVTFERNPASITGGDLRLFQSGAVANTNFPEALGGVFAYPAALPTPMQVELTVMGRPITDAA